MLAKFLGFRSVLQFHSMYFFKCFFSSFSEENRKGWCNDPRVLNLESLSTSSGEENLLKESEHRKSVSDSVKNRNPSPHQNVPYQGTPSKNHHEHVEWDDGSLGEWHKQLDCHGNQQCKSQCHSKLVSKWSEYFPPTPSRCIKVEERQKESTISPNCPQKNSFSQSAGHRDHNNTVESGTDLAELWDDKYDFELFKESPRKLIGDISVEHGNIIEDKVHVLYSGEEIEKSHQSSYASFARNKHRSLKDIFCRGKQFLKSKVSNYKNKLLNKDIISSGAELSAAAQEISGKIIILVKIGKVFPHLINFFPSYEIFEAIYLLFLLIGCWEFKMLQFVFCFYFWS